MKSREKPCVTFAMRWHSWGVSSLPGMTPGGCHRNTWDCFIQVYTWDGTPTVSSQGASWMSDMAPSCHSLHGQKVICTAFVSLSREKMRANSLGSPVGCHFDCGRNGGVICGTDETPRGTTRWGGGESSGNWNTGPKRQFWASRDVDSCAVYGFASHGTKWHAFANKRAPCIQGTNVPVSRSVHFLFCRFWKSAESAAERSGLERQERVDDLFAFEYLAEIPVFSNTSLAACRGLGWSLLEEEERAKRLRVHSSKQKANNYALT